MAVKPEEDLGGRTYAQQGVAIASVVIASIASVVAAWTVAAQQPANPRQQSGATITMFAPEQHDLYDGHEDVRIPGGLGLRPCHTERQAPLRELRNALHDHAGYPRSKTLRVNYPMANKKQPAGEVNPATQQIDFYIRSPQQNPKNKPNREVFLHFFGMEVTWK
jgi:hypothetical protein